MILIPYNSYTYKSRNIFSPLYVASCLTDQCPSFNVAYYSSDVIHAIAELRYIVNHNTELSTRTNIIEMYWSDDVMLKSSAIA